MRTCDCSGVTIGRALLKGKELLRGHSHVETPDLDAEVLLAGIVGVSRADLLIHGERELSQARQRKFFSHLQKRGEGVPVAYLTGEKEFMSLRFYVSTDCLIPRPETEVLVEEALALMSGRGLKNPRILELGTGSGCIAVSLAKNLARCAITATDISTSALRIARQNAETHEVGDRITFLEGDLYEALGGRGAGEFDLILSNPPYISADEEMDVPRSVKDYEPPVALWDNSPCGAASKVISLSGRIIGGSPVYLKKEGVLGLEINPRRCGELGRLFETSGFKNIRVIADLGGLPRVILGERNA